MGVKRGQLENVIKAAKASIRDVDIEAEKYILMLKELMGVLDNGLVNNLHDQSGGDTEKYNCLPINTATEGMVVSRPVLIRDHVYTMVQLPHEASAIYSTSSVRMFNRRNRGNEVLLETAFRHITCPINLFVYHISTDTEPKEELSKAIPRSILSNHRLRLDEIEFGTMLNKGREIFAYTQQVIAFRIPISKCFAYSQPNFLKEHAWLIVAENEKENTVEVRLLDDKILTLLIIWYSADGMALSLSPTREALKTLRTCLKSEIRLILSELKDSCDYRRFMRTLLSKQVGSDLVASTIV